MPEDVGLRLTADSAPLWVLALTLGNRGTCLMAKKIRPEGRKNYNNKHNSSPARASAVRNLSRMR